MIFWLISHFYHPDLTLPQPHLFGASRYCSHFEYGRMIHLIFRFVASSS